MKKLKILTAILLSCALLISGGCGKEEAAFEPWDNLDGGKQGSDVTEYSDETASEYLIDEVKNDDSSASGEYDSSSANYHEIDLENIGSSEDYSYNNDKLTIESGGVYVLSGTLNGAISVKGCSEAVQIVLNGATVNTTDSQNCAALVFKKPTDAAAERILTVKEGTTNTLSDSAGDASTDEDSDGAVIQAKKRSLTINGTGTLILNCKGDETSGIKVKTSLVVNGANIIVNNATKNGIKADEQIIIKNAKISITANGDGIKTDMEAETDDEAKTFASDARYGYIYIENSDINVTSGDDGISANNCLYIANTDDDTIKITTNGGAPSSVTERSSDNADGKGIKTDGIEFNDVTYAATYSQNYGLIITGGKFEINSNDDAFHSKGNLLVSGGTFDVSTGDDAFHSEYLTKILDGNITINKSYEGIEGATVEILGGNINVTSTDDGINAANSDLGKYNFYILIAGGNITVNANGDGIDSNGTIKITGGTVYVFGPTENDNAALDADTGIIIDGGNVFAAGSAGMVENPSENSKQYYINLTLLSAASANTTITVKDSENKTLLELSPSKKFQSVIISLSDFIKNATYTITVGNETYSATLSSIGTALGRNMQGGGNQGFRPNGDRR